MTKTFCFTYFNKKFQDQPFSSWKQLNLDFYNKICYEIFQNWTYKPETSWTNDNYGLLLFIFLNSFFCIIYLFIRLLIF